MNKFKDWPIDKPIRLCNIICPYCGASLTKNTSTKEHVIGRKFVPKGTLHKQWNLILNACACCNNKKADLENDISAIAMQPDVQGRHFSLHPQLALDAASKAKHAHSRYTGKPVADSKSKFRIEGELAPGTMVTLDFVGQAQISQRRSFELALRHFQAFFFLITYDHEENRGWWWMGKYAPIQVVSRRDWGNDLAIAFMQKTHDWDYRVIAKTAASHFRLAIRKHQTLDLWSLAVEWNNNYRVLAVCGSDDLLRDFLADLPTLKMDIVSQSANSFIKIRTEKELQDEDDTLFSYVPAGD